MRCCVPSPASIKIQSLFLLLRTANPETLRVRVGTPEDVPKKSKMKHILGIFGANAYCIL